MHPSATTPENAPAPRSPLGRPQRPRTVRSLLGRLCVPALALALLSGLTAPEARAQWAVIDPAHIAESVLNGKRLLDQIDNQAAQIRNEIQMLRRLANPPVRQIRQRVRELEGVMRAGESLGYSMDGLLQEFGVTFPGFRAYANWSAERRRQYGRSLQTLANSLVSIQQQGRQLDLSQTELERIRQAARAADGQTAQIEVGNTLTAFAAEELVLLRQLIAVQANAQAVEASQRINDEAQRAAAQEGRVRAMADYEHPRGRGFSGVLGDDGD